MTWLTNSSIGRKVVMSVTGAALVLFLLFHGAMNLVAIISEEGYNMICEFLGANWYAIVATMGLAFLMVVHIFYAFILSIDISVSSFIFLSPTFTAKLSFLNLAPLQVGQ